MKLLISLLIIYLLASSCFAFGYWQKEDKVIDNLQCSQHFIEGNGWEIRSFFIKSNDDLYAIRIWHGDKYLGEYRKVK